MSSISPIRVPPPTPAEPSAVDRAHKHEMMDELGQRRRSASISLDDGVTLMPSRVVPTVASDEVKGHKRQVSHTLHILKQAADQLEHRGATTRDEEAAPSVSPNLRPSEVSTGAAGLPAPRRRSSVTFDDSPEVIGGNDDGLGGQGAPVRMGLGERRPSSEHVPTPIPSPRRNSLSMSPTMGLQTPPHLVDQEIAGVVEDGNQAPAELEEVLASAMEEQLGEETEDPVAWNDFPTSTSTADGSEAPAVTDQGSSIYDQTYAATAKELGLPVDDTAPQPGPIDDAGSESSASAAEADDEPPSISLVPVDPTPLNERPAGPFPAPALGHSESGGSASDTSALKHSPEVGAGKEAELGAGLGHEHGSGTGIGSAVADALMEEVDVNMSGKAFEGVLRAAGGAETPSIGGVGISSATTAITGLLRDGEGAETFHLGQLDEAGGVVGRRRAGSKGEIKSERVQEREGEGEGEDASGIPRGHGRDATWATEVDEGGDSDSLPDLEAAEPTFSPNLNASTSTQSSTPGPSPKRPVVRTSPSQGSLKGKAPAKTSPTRLSSGGSSTAKAAKAREAQAQAARMVAEQGDGQGVGGLGSRKEGEGVKVGANRPKHGRPKGGKRKGSSSGAW